MTKEEIKKTKSRISFLGSKIRSCLSRINNTTNPKTELKIQKEMEEYEQERTNLRKKLKEN